MTSVNARPVKRWPLFLIAAPAAAAVWSGWVGLGGLCGFGVIHPLPGIAGGFHLNTAITLPIGVESYGAYALRAWLTPGISALARKYAARSAIGSLGLGMAGQVIYHLLNAAHATKAPWPVVTLISCLPVVALAFGSGLAHLLREPVPAPDTGTEPVPAGTGRARTAVRAAHTTGGRATPDTTAGARPRTGRPDGGTADGTGSRTAAVRQPGGEVDRAAVVAGLAEQIRDAIEAGQRWQPDYPALMARTGFRRSWCEKAVRDARAAAFGTAVPAPVIGTGGSPDGAAGTGTAPGPDEQGRTGRDVLHAVGSTGP